MLFRVRVTDGNDVLEDFQLEANTDDEEEGHTLVERYCSSMFDTELDWLSGEPGYIYDMPDVNERAYQEHYYQEHNGSNDECHCDLSVYTLEILRLDAPLPWVSGPYAL
jgi:hypothetical protein